MSDEPITVEVCHYCGKSASRDQAVKEGWQPDFWRGEEYVNQAVCAACFTIHCRIADDLECEEIVP